MGAIRPACDCNVYDHIVDQNFVGFAKESEPRVGQIWRAAVLRTLVDSSTGLAILSNGKPIQAYYFSSSGGQHNRARMRGEDLLPIHILWQIQRAF
jgi:stage II sporulation protein D